MEGREIDVIADKRITYGDVKYTFDWSRVEVGDWFVAKGGAQSKAAKRSLCRNPMTKRWVFDIEPVGRVSSKFTRIK